MITTFTLNHFGLVAGLCQELRISATIDTLIPPDVQQKVTTGQAVVAMIINGLGFSNRQLYLFPQFFENKPVELLVQQGLAASDFNDDTLGRALDRLYNYGCTELFCHVASVATKIAEVNKKFGHLDTTTFSVSGDYDVSGNDTATGDAIIHITYGHSKQKRPDLKQIFLNMLVTSDGGVPLFMQALDGNSMDSVTFRKTLTEFRRGLKNNLQEITYWVADSAFYCKETVQQIGNDIPWISRVPERLSEAKQLIATTAQQIFQDQQATNEEDLSGTPGQLRPLAQEGYFYTRHRSCYGEVEQRWLIIYSQPAKRRVSHTVRKKVSKEWTRLQKLKKQLQKQEFSTKKAALSSVSELEKMSRYHTCQILRLQKSVRYARRGRPAKDKPKRGKLIYTVEYSIGEDQNAIELAIIMGSLFIVATNELEVQSLSDQELFEAYKGQKHVERGFRFLKDPLFFASSLFLKKPQRIVSLTMVMCLSLLVYSIGERKLRQSLSRHQETIKNQLKKPTQRPTLRWIFQLFEDIHLVKLTEEGKTRIEVKNLRPAGIKALKMLGSAYMAPYLIT